MLHVDMDRSRYRTRLALQEDGNFVIYFTHNIKQGGLSTREYMDLTAFWLGALHENEGDNDHGRVTHTDFPA